MRRDEASPTDPLPSDPEAPELSGQQFLNRAGAFYLVLAIAGVVWIGLREGSIRSDLFLRPQDAAVDIGLGVVVAAFLWLAWRALESVSAEARSLTAKLHRQLVPLRSEQSLALALLSGIAEEVFFRGAVQGSFGLLVAAIVFAALHGGPSRQMLLWSIAAFVAGLVFGLLTLWRGSLLAAVVAHAGFNALSLRKRGSTAPPQPSELE